ncbi:MAG: TonB-dependent receptor [Bacteroidota bacterium]
MKLQYPIIPVLVIVLLFSGNVFSEVKSEKINTGFIISNTPEKITINREIKIIDLLNHISDVTDYFLLYKSDLEELNVIVKLNVKDETVSKVLNLAFKKIDLEYLIEDNYIIIRKTDTRKQFKKKKITGKITDNTEKIVEGVSVYIKGGEKGAVSNTNGIFTIEAYEGQTLVFSHIAFKEEEVLYSGQDDIHVVLSENVANLDDVVIVGYGKQKVRELTGSLSHITNSKLEEATVLNVVDALEGRAPGVVVTMPSGKPQKHGFIRIRGTTSIEASSDPLFVIDGIPTLTIYDISPNDVESITILKDASATAIYGSSGANGVVIIETKKEFNLKNVINFSSYIGSSEIVKKLGTLNSEQYIELMDELGLSTDWTKYNKNTDWQDEIYRKAFQQNYQLSFSGSDDGLNYYISGNWQKKEGIVRNSFAERLSGKVNIDKKVNERLKVGASFMYSKWHDKDVNDKVESGNTGVVLGALVTPSVIGIFDDDGRYSGNPLQPSFENPVAITDAPKQDYFSNRFLSNFFFEAKIAKGLEFRSSLSLDNSNGKYSYYLDPYSTDWGRVNDGLAQEIVDASTFWINENILTYIKEIGYHRFKLMGGGIISKNSTSFLNVKTRHFANGSIETINGGSELLASVSNEEYRSNVSYISRLNYSFQDKYLFTGNMRADASSVFGPEKRWGYFPSFSVGWRVSSESFMSNQSFIDDFKLRLGWGKVGNDRIAPYSWSGKVNTGYNYVFNGQILPGIAVETLDNSNLQWETTSQTNIGADLIFLNDRLSVVFDAYVKNTSDLLLSVPIPTHAGVSSSIQNVGKIQNKGLEFGLNAKIIDSWFNWNADFNIFHNSNKVVDLEGQILMTGNIIQRGNIIRVEEGKELGNFWGYVSEGVDPATGDIIYKDLNNDKKITAEGDRTIIGNSNPDIVYGLNNSFSYKRISLNVFVQGVYGNQVFNATRVSTEGMNDFKSQTSVVNDRWRAEGDISDIPRAVLGSKSNSEISDRFIEDGSYLRLKKLSLSYSFSEKLITKLKLSKLKIYVSAENLYTLSNYSGYDPEINAFGNSNLVQGVDYGTYPHAKSVFMGINMSF